MPFRQDAIAEIYRFSQGVARAIVQIANESLIRATVDRTKVVDKDTVVAAESELLVE